MAAEFYHVLAYPSPITSQYAPGDKQYQPVYVGKTTNLSFKVEAEKTVDCDDGTTIVGSEKLSLSFSILEEINTSLAISKLLLLPVVNQYGSNPPPPSKTATEVEFTGARDYQIEVKSGEFELTHFSATVRYASGTPPYRMIDNYYTNYMVHIIKRDDPFSSTVLPAKILIGGEVVAQEALGYSLLKHHTAALICPWVNETITLSLNTSIEYIKRYGIFFHHID